MMSGMGDSIGSQAAQIYLDVNGTRKPSATSNPWTIGGLLAPSNAQAGGLARVQHARAISLPVFSQDQPSTLGHARGPQVHPASSLSTTTFGSFGGGNGFGLAIQGNSGLPGWTEEEVVAAQ